MNRREKVSLVRTTLQWSAKELSRDGMTGISNRRAEHLALDVVDALEQYEGESTMSDNRMMMTEFYRDATDHLYRELGRYPSRDEVIAEVAIRDLKAREDEALRIRRREEEDEKIAQCQYYGHGKVYNYWCDPDIQIGEYLVVYSPLSAQDELVKVIGKGRGVSGVEPFKIAQRISWTRRG